MNRYYVAYGSNLNLEQMARRCPTAKVVGKGMINDYKLAFWGVATILPQKGSKVPVAVWEIDESCERALDVYEGFPRLYRKVEKIRVEMYDGSEITGMVYIMNYHRGEDAPALGYYNVIEQGYEDCGLDISYLEAALDEAVKK